jgi:alcohol dehydrogenase
MPFFAISLNGCAKNIPAQPETIARSLLCIQMGADHAIDIREEDPVAEILRLTGGRGVDVAIEALGIQQTFENSLRVLRAGGTLSSLGVYSGKLAIPPDSFAAGLGDHKIITTLCPGGKERMRRLMELVRHRRVDLTPLLTHSFSLDQIVDAYTLFKDQRDEVLKVLYKNSPGTW